MYGALTHGPAIVTASFHEWPSCFLPPVWRMKMLHHTKRNNVLILFMYMFCIFSKVGR